MNPVDKIDYTNKMFKEKDADAKVIWYSLRTFEKQERKTAESFVNYIKSRDLLKHLVEIFLPKQTLITVKRGKKVMEEKNFYPGHVFICLDAMPDITGDISQFLLKKGKIPCKFTQIEIDNIKSKVAEFSDKPKASIDFGVNSRVRIVSGLYTDMKGIVKQINFDEGTVIVELDICGGSIPAEISLLNVTNDE